MKSIIFKLLIFCLLAFNVSAQQQIINAVVTITNQTVFVTNGQTITINGTVRTWTNVVTSAQNQIQQTNSSVGCVTNLFLAYAIVPATGINISYSASLSNVTFQSFAGLPLTIALSPGWASLTLTTNNIGTNTLVIRGPPSNVGLNERTNAANDIFLYLTDPAETNKLSTNATILTPWYGFILNAVNVAVGVVSNAISANGGFGTNTTIVNSLALQSFQGNSLIPVVGSTISASSVSGSHQPINAFTNYPINLTSFGWENNIIVTGTNWIQYQFPSPVTASQMYLGFNPSGPTNANLQASQDGVSWVTVFTTNGFAQSQQIITNSFVATTASYWRWNVWFPNNANTYVSTIYGAQLYGSGSFGISSSNILIVTSPAGMVLNTNTTLNAGGNGFESGGLIDSETGFNLQGQSITYFGGYIIGQWTNTFFGAPAISAIANIVQQTMSVTNFFLTGTNFVSGTWIINTNIAATAFVVTINPGPNPSTTNLAGLYLSATNNNSYYTNFSGWQYVPTNSGLPWIWGASSAIVSNWANINQNPSYFLTYPNPVQYGIPENQMNSSGWQYLSSINVQYSNSMTSYAGTRVVIGANFTSVTPETLSVAGNMSANGYGSYSNIWNLASATNGMINFETRFNVNSNGVPVDIYINNGIPVINSAAVNTVTSVQAGLTNVALIGATSLTVYFTTGFSDTNWFPTMVEAGGTAIPALAFTAITTNSFSTSMTALTFSGGLWFTGTHKTQ